MKQSIKLDLKKLQGAFLMNMKGKTATKQCLIIPVEDAHLFVGAKTVSLDLVCIDLQNSQYGDTHMVKQSLPKEVYNAMSEEERKALPILGNMRPLQGRKVDAEDVVESADELPF